MSELKKCPFCGNEADISDGGYSGEKWLVRCISGRADNDLPECPAAEGATYKTKEEAIKAWNKRESEAKKDDRKNI
jgi:hypothetical protein